ncbi:PIN domain-containing protein [Nostoc sp. CENA67]|uniref:PIN domain-containing protein n=1 Tax=Amazonocrinis nigriterrae CENA67 TaxID=2794033 RepID=A0A8J7HST9_9NOST|nr:PIN domain-containing protein [Amazonocrinis nigriterrae]MBH8565047.1 PIN domain-containing protein [Amazonocrinis nigriterrae CENA67]
MKVIVDTSVWSLAFRHNSQVEDSPHIALLRDLITDNRVALLGAVRQEILSGIRHTEHYNLLRNYLHGFPNLELDIEDYELGSEFYNTCRHHDVMGTNTDFLICAAAVRRNYRILTTDKDFENFSQCIPITLVQC